ncbi:hypothetical protein GCM10023187_04180 [Nibrella viscosa]|uniref:Nucleotidyl transferase AbiEii toxin, Type IV TA system n=1 Tax=Nibrella viscosa TaxID=1084524 RepID=A0ABP8JUH8_9BACT
MDVDEFIRFVEAAARHQVSYILIGGLALILNGGIRYTQVADVWMEPTNENRDRLIKTLLEIDFDEDDLIGLANADFTQPQIIRLDCQIDILTSVHRRLNYYGCRQRANAFTMAGGQQVYFLYTMIFGKPRF